MVKVMSKSPVPKATQPLRVDLLRRSARRSTGNVLLESSSICTTVSAGNKRARLSEPVQVVRNRVSIKDPIKRRPPARSARNHISRVPTDVFRIIFGVFEPAERMMLRGVCHQWKRDIEDLCLCLQYVRINLTDRRVAKGVKLAPTWNPQLSLQRFQFELTWDEPVLDPYAKVSLTIRKKYFTDHTIELLSRMLSNVKTLVIYNDLHNFRDSNVSKFVQLLQQFRNRVDSLSIVWSNELNQRLSTPLICSAVEQMSTSFRRLDLLLPDVNVYGDAPLELNNSLRLVDHFSISCYASNLGPIMQTIGSRHGRMRSLTLPNPYNHGLTSLSIHCSFLKEPEFPAAFAKNPQIAPVRRLQLCCPPNASQLGDYLGHFPNVEQLQLLYCHHDKVTLGVDLIRIFSTKTKLTELTLMHHVVDLESHDKHNLSMKSVKKLTMFNHDFVDLLVDLNTNTVNYGLFARIIAKQFPSVEELRIVAGETAGPLVSNETLEAHLRDECSKLKRVHVDLTDAFLATIEED